MRDALPSRSLKTLTYFGKNRSNQLPMRPFTCVRLADTFSRRFIRIRKSADSFCRQFRLRFGIIIVAFRLRIVPKLFGLANMMRIHDNHLIGCLVLEEMPRAETNSVRLAQCQTKFPSWHVFVRAPSSTSTVSSDPLVIVEHAILAQFNTTEILRTSYMNLLCDVRADDQRQVSYACNPFLF